MSILGLSRVEFGIVKSGYDYKRNSTVTVSVMKLTDNKVIEYSEQPTDIDRRQNSYQPEHKVGGISPDHSNQEGDEHPGHEKIGQGYQHGLGQDSRTDHYCNCSDGEAYRKSRMTH